MDSEEYYFAKTSSVDTINKLKTTNLYKFKTIQSAKKKIFREREKNKQKKQKVSYFVGKHYKNNSELFIQVFPQNFKNVENFIKSPLQCTNDFVIKL